MSKILSDDTVTVTLPAALKAEVDALLAESGMSRDDLILKAIEDYLFVHRFQELRERIAPYARAAGFHTDEDVFREIS